ncbi:MAG: PstS family phosphate ABC transporter substrate-binding protein [candidate division Zixibacteria bacterium]|nr:PstS family phosphate ABC transporter substrate-binding protein [candidate division Zixibacteria bacterium]NIR63094.1 PstS family phosphate ABC transporter substrate-binding protein [candidate division Zixibacteria bacterium]NIS16570.1 PstS family phosphate ABC transporter substrate-binding protein [candidate division Zixibacteria bacterium]NIS45091.1 PstS family phosphate ABC transporter substrate-binding protein [candidate division Zixibacteria bacterium]NIT52646.1 PstS family phosphate AB
MKKSAHLMLMLLALMSMMLISACGGGEEEVPEEETGSINIKGSDTMVHLVSSWAEQFINAHEGIDVAVTGGGSGTGIAALINGTTDICAASREIKPKEMELAKEAGIQPVEYVVALDGIAVCVNPENPISELSLEQLKKIYTGAYTNWSQVGGPDEPILVLSRESSSGTYVFFQEHVLDKEDYTDQARLMPATSSIIQSTAEDKWAIGYVGLGYADEAADRIKVIGVKETAEAEAVYPSVETVLDGTYSIARPLHLYTNGEAAGIIADFVNYCMSVEGQQIVKETGYVPVN